MEGGDCIKILGFFVIVKSELLDVTYASIDIFLVSYVSRRPLAPTFNDEISTKYSNELKYLTTIGNIYIIR